MLIALASDHAGFELKEQIRDFLLIKGYEILDMGPETDESVDYPDFAHPLALLVDDGSFERGILVCGSGQGVCMTANKYANVRAALAWNPEVAALTRQHNDANVLCLPGRMIELEKALEAVLAFLQTDFEGGRHQRRADKIKKGDIRIV